MIEIRPYAGVGPLRFGMSPAQTIEHLHGPSSATSNRSNETVHRYPTLTLTFDGEGLAEVSILPEGIPHLLSFDPLTRSGLTNLALQDGDPQEVLGFVVMLNLGIAVTGVHDDDVGQLAVSAFRKGRWEKFRDGMRPFSDRKVG